MGRKKHKGTREVLALGEAFLRHLKATNEGEVFQKQEMSELYNNSFKKLAGADACKGCSFSSILYCLRMNHRIKMKGDTTRIMKGFLAKDQYSKRKQLQDAFDLGLGDEQDFAEDAKHPYYCRCCDVHGNSAVSFIGHLKGKKHLQQLSLKKLKDKRDTFIQKRFGIEVSCEFGDLKGMIAFNTVRHVEKKFTIEIKNASTQSHTFLCCLILKILPAIKMEDVECILLPPGMELSIQFTVKTDSIGVLHTPMLIAFKPANERTTFQILRFLKVNVESDVAKDLPPTIPYVRPKKESRKPSPRDIVDGFPLLMEDSKLKMGQLAQYSVPNHLRDNLNKEGAIMKLEESLEASLSWVNYGWKLHTLLYIEECQMEVDIRRYDMHGTTMKRCDRLLKLKVPGLAENRPSVLKGDHVLASFSRDSCPKTYKGYVHAVELEEVALGFASEFLERFVDNIRLEVQFTFSRVPLRRQHFAIEKASGNADLEDLLFPSAECLGKKPLLCSKIEESSIAKMLYDQKLSSNDEQMRAIYHIVQGTSRPAPYLVFGPPGTGKTVTIVEAIKQVYKNLPQCRILACAPSNSAADLIAARLVAGTGTPVTMSALFRMNAYSRDWRTVDPALKECCNYDKMKGEQFFPAKEELLKKRIIVCTLSTAGRLSTAKDFPQDHFTHVFIDEAGHAIEPEAIIALANLLDPNNALGGQVVLAGDPKQLGPILRSPIALEHGLELSFLERLMTKCKVYKRRGEAPFYDSRVLTKLLRNYRSHPAILKLPNQMFYANELETCADQMVRECMCKWDMLPTKGFPIIFHGVEGVDEREDKSPSFFNKSEIEVVVEYTMALLEKRGGIKVKQSNIGIISPYRRQVQKIKQVLKKRKINDIKVGSVEEFQGQERLAIIVSTVRSTKPEHIQMDIDYKLGFVKNPKRLNVAVTRAKALLILVGNPYMLRRDNNWSMFLEDCLFNNAYVGCEYRNDDDEVEDAIQKFTKSEITADLVDEPLPNHLLGVSVSTEQSDPQWRSED